MCRFIENHSVIVRVTRFFNLFVLLCASGAVTASSLQAEVKSVPLSDSYSRFAVQPETGVIAAIHRRDQEVHFFRPTDLQAGLGRPVAKVFDIGFDSTQGESVPPPCNILEYQRSVHLLHHERFARALNGNNQRQGLH